MSQNLPVPADDRMIFLPTETLSQRVVEAEKKVETLRKQRSRSILAALVTGVAFLASLLMIGAILMFTNGQISEAKTTASTLVEDTKAESEKRLADIGKIINQKDQVIRTLTEKSEALERRELEGLIREMFEYEHQRDELRRMIELYSAPDQKPNETGWFALANRLKLNQTPPEWTIAGLQRDSWIKGLTAAYQADTKAINAAIREIEAWAEPKPVQKFVPRRREDPWAPPP